MFIMPIPPTTREIDAMPPSIVESIALTEFMVSKSEDRLMMEKLLSASLKALFRSARISCSAMF